MYQLVVVNTVPHVTVVANDVTALSHQTVLGAVTGRGAHP